MRLFAWNGDYVNPYIKDLTPYYDNVFCYLFIAMSKTFFLKTLLPSCMEHVALLLDSVLKREKELNKIDPYLLQVVHVSRYSLNRWGPVVLVSRFLWDVRQNHLDVYFGDSAPACDINIVDSFLTLLHALNPKFKL